MKEWFTIAELRGSGVASMTEARLKRLTERFGDLSPTRSRTRVTGDVLEAEFHVLMFPLMDQMALQRAEPAIDIAKRIYKLGIHRDLTVEQRNYHRGDDVTVELLNDLQAKIVERLQA